MCKIFVFRHGRTDYNVKGLFTGWRDSHLVLRGRRDAKRIARMLKDERIDLAIQTRLSRSQETLQFVLKFHPECQKILTDDSMIERSYGVLEGTSHKEFIRRAGKKLVDLKVEGDALVDLSERERKKLERFLGGEEYHAIHRGYTVAALHGESFRDVERRVKQFIVWLKVYVKKHKVNVAVSAHGNSIRLFRKIWERASRAEATNWVIPYDKVYTYTLRI